jgi:hypothetical protein
MIYIYIIFFYVIDTLISILKTYISCHKIIFNYDILNNEYIIQQNVLSNIDDNL